MIIGGLMRSGIVRKALMKQLKINPEELKETKAPAAKTTTRAQAAAPMRTKSKEEEQEKSRTRRVRASSARRINRSM